MLFEEREEDERNWKQDEVRRVNESGYSFAFNGSLRYSFPNLLNLVTSIQYYQYFGLMESVLQSLREEFFVTQGDSSESGKVTLSSC